MKKILKENKGLAASDGLMAVLIIALFTGIIATLLYNIYISNTSLKRMSTANLYLIDVLEYVDKVYYDDVTANNLTDYFNNKFETDNQVRAVTTENEGNTPYKVIINVQKYNETEGNTDKLDLVKQITVKVNYKVGNREQKIEVSRIKSRENLLTPNKPDLNLVSKNANEKVYPVKQVDGSYKVCREDDSNWYNYDTDSSENSITAKVIVTEIELSTGDLIGELDENTYTIYEWIPRYAEDADRNIIYLFSNTNNYVESFEQEDGNTYQKLSALPEGYTTEFEDTQTGRWQPITND